MGGSTNDYRFIKYNLKELNCGEEYDHPMFEEIFKENK